MGDGLVQIYNVVLISGVQQSDLIIYIYILFQLPRCLSDKESACQAEDMGLTLGQEGPLEEEMAIHSSVLAWRTPRRGHGQVQT